MKDISRRSAIILIGAAAMSLVGCGSTEKEAGSTPTSTGNEQKTEKDSSEPKPLEIIESGWSVGESGYVFYGIGIKNPNDNYGAGVPSFRITGKADDGSIVFNDEQTLFVIYPAETVYYGFQAGNGTAPETVEFAISDCEWEKAEPLGDSVFSISNTSEVDSGYGTMSYTGELSMNLEFVDEESADLFNQTAVTAILRDESGEIVYGMTTFVDTPGKDESVPFEVGAYNAPSHDSFELYAQLW